MDDIKFAPPHVVVAQLPHIVQGMFPIASRQRHGFERDRQARFQFTCKRWRKFLRLYDQFAHATLVREIRDKLRCVAQWGEAQAGYLFANHDDIAAIVRPQSTPDIAQKSGGYFRPCITFAHDLQSGVRVECLVLKALDDSFRLGGETVQRNREHAVLRPECKATLAEIRCHDGQSVREIVRHLEVRTAAADHRVQADFGLPQQVGFHGRADETCRECICAEGL